MNFSELDQASMKPLKQVNTYELGKWHPELGDLALWVHQKLQRFKEGHEYISHETIGLTSGGVLLLAKGSQ